MISRHCARPGSASAPAGAARMLERVVQPRHLHELDRPVEVAREPQLLEVGDVAQVPEDRAHQRIVLRAEVLVAQRRHQQQRPGARLEQLVGDDFGIDTAGRGRRRSWEPPCVGASGLERREEVVERFGQRGVREHRVAQPSYGTCPSWRAGGPPSARRLRSPAPRRPESCPSSGSTRAFMNPRDSSSSSARATWFMGIFATRYARPWRRASFSLKPIRPSWGSMNTA